MSAQIYTKLQSPTSFRLLKPVVSSSETQSAFHNDTASVQRNSTPEISFALTEHDTVSCPQYAALSYTWGPSYLSIVNNPPEKTTSRSDLGKSSILIKINNRPFEASQNMLDALNCATHNISTSEIKHIWIDGICINQSDSLEKSVQVQMMGQIYGSATRVVAFLGGPHPRLSKFITMVNDMAPSILELIKKYGRDTVFSGPMSTAAVQAGFEQSHFRDVVFGSREFYKDCRWFARAWIRQEVVLAKDLWLCCGDSKTDKNTNLYTRINWFGLALLGTWMWETHWSWELGGFQSEGTDLTDDMLWKFGIEWWAPHQDHSNDSLCSSYETLTLEKRFNPFKKSADNGPCWLWHWATKMIGSLCFDERDKIYAAMGMAHKFFRSPPSDFVKVDYTIPVEQVYIQLVKSLINSTGSLNYLSYREDARRRVNQNLPSWCVDFSGKVDFSLLAIYQGTSWLHEYQKRNFASDVSCADARLSAFGARFSTVSVLAKERTPVGTPDWDSILSLLALVKDIDVYCNGQSRLQALWRTYVHDVTPRLVYPASDETLANSFSFMTMGLAAEINRRVKQDGSTIDQAISDLESTIFRDFTTERENGTFPSTDLLRKTATLIGHFPTMDGSQPLEVISDEVKQLIQELTPLIDGTFSYGYNINSCQSSDRLCFKTNDGFLGMGMISINVDDEVWFVEACAIPLLFRPTGAKGVYKLIGSCYLHGFMTGAIFEDRWKLAEKWERFTLV